MARSETQNLKFKRVFRRLLTYLLLAVLLWIFYLAAGRALCYIAMRQIAGLTNTKIRTGSVDFHTNGSVYIKNLVINPYQQHSDDEAILTAENVYARFSLSSFLSLRPRLKAIDVNDFGFNARYDLDTGGWNLSPLQIRPLKGGPSRMPSIHLRAGTLQYSRISKGQTNVALCVPLNARFEFDEETREGYSFEVTTAATSSGFGRSRLTGYWRPGSVTLTGGISSIDVPELEMAWTIDALAAELKYDQNDVFSLKLNMKDLHGGRGPAPEGLTLARPAFLKEFSPFAALQRFFQRYRPHGRVDIDLEAAGRLSRLSESTLAGSVYCKDVAFCHRAFQYPIEHLIGPIDFTEQSVTLNNLIGRHGDAELSFTGWCKGFGPGGTYDVQIRSDNMPLDADLYDALSTRQQEFWCAFSPTGAAAIDYQFSRTSQTGAQEKLAIELRGADAVYQHFPYPLKNLSGRLSFEGNKVVFCDVVSPVDKQKITVNGEITNEGTNKPIYDISIMVNNMPLDSTLEAALPQRQKNLYKRFGPAGLADGWVKVSTQESGSAGFTADLSFKEGALKSGELPFPVRDITASAVFTPDLIIVKEFSGRYDNGLISLAGQIQPDGQYGQLLYRLTLKLTQAQLDDDLFRLLPDRLRGLASDLKPEGKVNLSADLNKESLTKPPDYSIAIECLRNSAVIPSLCYLLQDVTGTVVISPDNIALEKVAATLGDSGPTEPNKAGIKLNGRVTLTHEAFSSATLALDANNIRFDDQLAQALPQNVQSLYESLSPSGPLDLEFENIRVLRTDDGQESVDFDGAIAIRNCGFAASGSQIELDTVLQTQGLYRTGEGFIRCRAAIDGGTLKIRGKSFTGLKTNVFYDPNSRDWSTQDLTADWYGGRLRGEFVFTQPTDKAGEYVLQTGFDNVDLKRFLSDAQAQQMPENGHTSGRMNGSFSMYARVGDSSSRIGTCKLIISDMQVGKRSPLAKLLDVLKLTEPQDHAFDQMFVDSYIKHNGLVVKKLDLSGRSVAFYGSGRMDLQTQNVDLALIARGRRLATADPSIWQSLTEGLGQGVVRMDVAGNLYDPKITTKTLPVIEGTLQILGAKPATQD